MDIYSRIKFLREQKNMTQEELAEKTGYKTRSAINKIEKGLRDINQSQIKSFADALGVTPSYLMGWEDEIEENEVDHYYLNPETRKLAQEVYENPNLRILFDAARDVEPEDIQMAVDMLERFKKTRY